MWTLGAAATVVVTVEAKKLNKRRTGMDFTMAGSELEMERPAQMSCFSAGPAVVGKELRRFPQPENQVLSC